MNNNKLTILFLLQKVKVNKKGKCPVRCRITYLKKRKEFSLGLFLNSDYWDSKRQKAKPPNPDNNYINTQLSLISQKINEAFLFLQVNDKAFDVEDIYLQYKGENVKTRKTLLEVFKLHNERMFKLIDVDCTKSTYRKFIEANKHTANFIKYQYNKTDILLESIKMNFLKDFDFYLKTELNHKQITINKSIQRVRKIIKLALAEGYLQKDPFLLYKPKRYETKVVYLNQEELKDLEKYRFSQKRLSQVRDMFIFCCYTGLAYAEMSNLSKEHLIIGFDGNISDTNV
ncbi:site-specific integrase [Lacinutrix neustonica]|uniref:site-specific integrase n=1 Tax=Lacinutrix neustonica TaxID=2980107 RepID=UPI0028BD6215|nr:site-specific integrase [Lacinutrix neustonica]